MPARFHEVWDSEAATHALLSMSEPPTCIFYPDDDCYLGGLAEIERRGLSVPEDVSCVGFDGTKLTGLLRPRLTTYHQDAVGMGRLAAQEIISAIEDPKCYAARNVYVPGRMQPGDTVRDLRR